jgi:hypothetical protein
MTIIYKKYTRTKHHPMSKSITGDDKVISLADLEKCYGNEYVASLKMDGECTTIYKNGYTHARSIDSKYHKSRTWINSFAASICFKIPSGLRVCGENLFAKHSIKYLNLPSYFMGFSVWGDDDISLSWDDTVALFEKIGVTPVEVVWRGILTPDIVKSVFTSIDTTTQEGVVFRPTSMVSFDNFGKEAFKVVREGHVQTDGHWLHAQVIKNELL